MKTNDASSSSKQAVSSRKAAGGPNRQDYIVGLASSLFLGGVGARPKSSNAAEINLAERIESPELKSPGLAGFGSPTVVFLPR